MNNRNLLLAFLLGAVVAGLGTWMAVRSPASSTPAGMGRADGEDPGPGSGDGTHLPGDGTRPAELQGSPDAPVRLADLREENERLREEVAKLEAELERMTPKPLDPHAFRFGVPEKAPSFDNAEWTKLGGHMVNLSKLLATLPEIVASGREPNAAEIGNITRENMPLAMFAGTFGADTGDMRPNSAFTHPAVIANLIRATLVTAEEPLTHEQEIAIKTLGDAWLADDRRIRSSWPTTGLALEKLVEEVDAKLRFLSSTKNVLTSTQRQVLWIPENEDRLKLDLLSPVLVYMMVNGMPVPDREGMETALVKSLLDQAGVKDVDMKDVSWIGREWVDDLPAEVLAPVTPTSLSLRFPHVNKLQAQARAQVAATERLLAMGKLTEKQAETLRGLEMLSYPFILQGSDAAKD